jgi:peptidoglycan/LPS O-acetylase OafA/YrhL
MHRNNFDFSRLLFAIFVIITHSYSLSGIPEKDWLYSITHGQTSLSYIGVRGFFIISGYLIFQSLERSKTITSYYWKRILRIFPGLFIVLLLTVIFGFVVFEGSFGMYLKTRTMWTYIPNNIVLYRLQNQIEGIFVKNPYPGIINGCLWTLPYEFFFYICISLLFFFKKNIKYILVSILLILLLIARLFYIHEFEKYSYASLDGIYVADMGAFFMGGAFLSAIKIEKIPYKSFVLITLLVLFIILTSCNYFEKSQYILLAPIVIIFGILSTPYINSISAVLGDFSYGIYIYGFPIQQTLMHYYHFNFWELMLASIPLSVLFGALSWHFVEKKALQLKKIF